jgi:protein fantom
VHTDHLRLQTESRAAEDASKQTDYMMKRIEESRLERDRL